MDIERPLDDAELDQLERALAGPAFKAGAMSIDAMQGFFAAVASSPRPLAREDWLPHVIGDAPAYGSIEEADAIEGLIARIHAEVSAGLYSGEGFMPILPRAEGADTADSDPIHDAAVYSEWCLGYLAGANLWADDVDTVLSDPEITDPFFTIEVLAGDYDDELEEIAAERGVSVEDYLASCGADLFEDVQDIYEYLLERRKGETIRREEPKVGRNDPCPCGSGRKWKQCHGAS